MNFSIKRSRRLFCLLAALTAILCVQQSVAAPEATARVIGTVTDENGVGLSFGERIEDRHPSGIAGARNSNPFAFPAPSHTINCRRCITELKDGSDQNLI